MQLPFTKIHPDIIKHYNSYEYFKENTLPIGNMGWTIGKFYTDHTKERDAVAFIWEYPNSNSFISALIQDHLITRIANRLNSSEFGNIYVENGNIVIYRDTINNGIILPKGVCSHSYLYTDSTSCKGLISINLDDSVGGEQHTTLKGEKLFEFTNDIIKMFYDNMEWLFLESRKKW